MDAIPTVLFLLVVAAGLAFWVYAVADVVRIDGAELRSGAKIVWVLVVLIGQLPGALLYFGLARPRPGT